MTGRITGSAGVRSSISTTTRPRRATCRARATAAASSPKPSTSNSDYHFLRHAASHHCPSQIPVRRHPENGATDFENHTIVGSRGGVLMPRRRHSSVRERLKIYDCQVGKNQIICLRFANLRKVGRRHPTFLSPSASSGRHRLPGQKIGAAAPLFPVREGSRTATIAVLTDQGRSSSCKM